jgi:hypothetical protein
MQTEAKEKSQLSYDMGRVMILDKESGNWKVVATFPHQTTTKLSNNSLALKFMRILMDLENN